MLEKLYKGETGLRSVLIAFSMCFELRRVLAEFVEGRTGLRSMPVVFLTCFELRRVLEKLYRGGDRSSQCACRV